jgi:molybdopterin synthase catalytic subunit
VALDYSAYVEMASRQMQELDQLAAGQWPVRKVVMLHRIGRVGLGQPSILIGVATPHRAEAFAACRWLVDELKKSVVIWKQEVWTDGQQTWVHPDPTPGA